MKKLLVALMLVASSAFAQTQVSPTMIVRKNTANVFTSLNTFRLLNANAFFKIVDSSGTTLFSVTPTTTTVNNFTPSFGSSITLGGDTTLTRTAAATLQHGAADAAAPVAQIEQVQNVVAGTSNTAGADYQIIGSRGTGTGAGGKIIFKAANAGNTGSTQNTANTILTLVDVGTAGTSTPSTQASGQLEAIKLLIQRDGSIVFSNSNGFNGTAVAASTLTSRTGTAIQFGPADSATPTAQLLAFQGSRGGTDSNVAGTNSTIQSSLGTGNAAASQLNVSRALMGASGNAQQTASNAITVCESKTLSNTSATTTTIANINLPSNSAGGLVAWITVTASDGTNFDVETQQVTQSYVNKAGTITFGTALISTSTAVGNSGSTTIGATLTGATPTVSLKVTPVFTTIVPTTVTAYVEIHNHGTGNVTCQ